MSDRPVIVWDRPKLERFKRAYKAARLQSGSDVFQFDGHEFVLDYAKYLIEYLDSELPKA